MLVKRKSGPDWRFEYIQIPGIREKPDWYFRTQENTYTIYFNSGSWADMCVMRLYEHEDGTEFWGTCEGRIGATSIMFGRGEYFFGR